MKVFVNYEYMIKRMVQAKNEELKSVGTDIEIVQIKEGE